MRKGPFRVFVVEDHAATARGLKVFLELAGYVVTIASDMRSALKLGGNCDFDVLVCDLNLPDGTGWELMETLRKEAPVRGIVFSAFEEPEHVARSKAVGFEEHVVKGTTPEALLAAIDRIARFEFPSEQELSPAAQNGDRPVAATPKKRPPARKRGSTPAKVRS
ncbi:MAG: response regulator [Chthoniobacterales bacterium]